KYPNDYELPLLKHSIRLKTFNKYFLILLIWFIFIIAAFKYSDEIIIMYFLIILNPIITLVFELKFNLIKINFYDDFLKFEYGFFLFKVKYKKIKYIDYQRIYIQTRYINFIINTNKLSEDDLDYLAISLKNNS
ncbi:hypothetical protein, partial [Campylobacter sp. 2018MI13]|uniref:hypothetical protein n=1 Tax=Campylobacter sp. 2018MI13 TaxID=2836737 RepID=UPI001BD9C376